MVGRAIQRALVLLAMTSGVAAAGQTSEHSVVRQSLDDAWWTGPMLAPSAATLPSGHLLVEPYVYDVAAYGRFDRGGRRHLVPHSDGFGTLAYLLYGLADGVTVGFIPTAGFNKVSNGPNSSGIGLGDVTVHGQYRLTQFHERSWHPATAIVLQETLPTGRYDRLRERPSDAFGNGAYTTTVGLFSQAYFWLPNGRILRMRLDVSQAFSTTVRVNGVSVYGTGAGFRGKAKPGGSFFADASWEYSLSRSWVLALDATYRWGGNTRTIGSDAPDSGLARNPTSVVDSWTSEAFGLAPAIEYSWTPNLGVLVGARVIARGRNTPATMTPVVAINIVR